MEREDSSTTESQKSGATRPGRTLLACNSCRRSRVKCYTNSTQTRCSRCTARGSRCEYTALTSFQQSHLKDEKSTTSNEVWQYNSGDGPYRIIQPANSGDQTPPNHALEKFPVMSGQGTETGPHGSVGAMGSLTESYRFDQPAFEVTYSEPTKLDVLDSGVWTEEDERQFWAIHKDI